MSPKFEDLVEQGDLAKIAAALPTAAQRHIDAALAYAVEQHNDALFDLVFPLANPAWWLFTPVRMAANSGNLRALELLLPSTPETTLPTLLEAALDLNHDAAALRVLALFGPGYDASPNLLRTVRNGSGPVGAEVVRELVARATPVAIALALEAVVYRCPELISILAAPLVAPHAVARVIENILDSDHDHLTSPFPAPALLAADRLVPFVPAAEVPEVLRRHPLLGHYPAGKVTVQQAALDAAIAPSRAPPPPRI